MSLQAEYERLGTLESLCICFFDLVDSTYLKSKMGQSRGVDLAVNHNQVAATISQQFKGRVIKYIGDAIMVVFNTPLEGMLASLEFVKTIHTEQLPFRTKIGIVQGVVTRIDANGVDYLGHACDRSARLNSQALPNQIITDENTLELIKPFLKDLDRLIFRFLGVRDLKGIGSVPLYEISLVELGFIKEDANASDIQIDESGAVKKKAPPPLTTRVRVELPPLAVLPAVPVPAKDVHLGRMLEAHTLSKKEVNLIAISFQNIMHLLEKAHELHIRKISLGGAFARGTMIKPMQSIDVIIVMAPPSSQCQGTRESVQALAAFLAQGDPDLDIIKSEQGEDCILITLQDIRFLITPVMAVIEKGQGQLMVPKEGFWVAFNPTIPEQWMEMAVRRNGPAFLPFLRLLRMWQRSNCNSVNSFHLDLITDMISSQVKLELSFESIFQWFSYVYNSYKKMKKPFVQNPSKPNSFADDYLFRSALVYNLFARDLANSYNMAAQATSYNRAGKNEKAMKLWKDLFGDYWEKKNQPFVLF